MDPSFEEAFDFDLNYIQQPDQNVVPFTKLRKAVLMTKKKTMSTDLLIKKYHANFDVLHETELMLANAKEECKKVCIDYKNTLEKCTGLEKDIKILEEKYKTLQAQYTVSQNQYEAIKSHANQLQSLVKENELKIESLQLEKHLEEKNNDKDNTDIILEKNVTSLTKKNEILLSHILILKDVVLGKKKLQKQHKVILSKYNKSEKETNDEDHNGNYSSDETDIFDDCMSPPSNEVFLKPRQNQDSQTEAHSVFKDTTNGHATNGTNGVQESEHDSEDTGRGSSLASSDGGKFFNSPDYYAQDSPHVETEQNNAIKFADASTCTSYNAEEKATSPIMFDDISDLGENIGIETNTNSITNPDYSITDIPLSTEAITIKEKRKLVDSSTSPICDVERSERIDIALSPIAFINEDLLRVDTVECSKNNKKSINALDDKIETLQNLEDSPNQIQNVTEQQNEDPSLADSQTDILNHSSPEFSSVELSTHTEMKICDKNDLEKTCLEKHNSKNLTEKGNNDTEVERILSSMRLDHKLLTPIPHTPSKPREKSNKKKTLMPCSQHECYHIGCIETLKLRKESKVLKKKYDILSKDIINIKSSLYTLNILPFNNTLNDDSNQNNNKSNVTKDVDELDRNTETNSKEIIHKDNIPSHTDDVCALKNKNKININILDKSQSLHVIDEDNVPLSHLMPNDVSKPNICRSITFEDDPPKKDDDININIDDKNNENSDEKRKSKKNNRKLSKLEKLRHKMLPKYKIAQNTILKKNLKPIVVVRNKVEMDKLIKSKLAYQKAIKIMAEAKEKNSDSEDKNKLIRNYEESMYINNENNADISNNESQLTLQNNQKQSEEHLIFVVSTRKEETNKQLESKQKTVEKNHKSSCSENNRIENVTLGEDASNLVKRTTRSRSKLFDQSEINALLSPYKQDYNCNISPQKQDHKYNNSPQKQDHKSNDSPQKQDHKYNYSPQKQDHKYNNSPQKQDHKCNDSPQKQDHKYNYSPQKQDHKYNNSPQKQDHKCNDSPQKQDHKCNNSPQKLDHNYSNSPKKREYNCYNKVDNPKVFNTETKNTINSTEDNSTTTTSPGSRKRLKRAADEVIESACKRVLRSSKVKEPIVKSDQCTTSDKLNISNDGYETLSNNRNSTDINVMNNEKCMDEPSGKQVITYGDLDLFSITEKCNISDKNDLQPSNYPMKSILCKMIDKYGKKTTQFSSNKVSEQVLNAICDKLEEDVTHIIQLPADKSKQGMNKLVEDIQKLPRKNFILGFIRYLKKPARKQEMFKTINTPPAPPMTKAEQILLYIVNQLNNDNSDIVDMVLTNIEYSLFQLNRTPDFDAVESMSHFYALVCRYFRLKNRLRLFILDAMYCLSFKVVTVVKQCLDVWMHILPLAHMGIAKSPLVTCLVYLLHFYKCEDKFKRIDGIRFILQQKYFYRISDWNETKMLEMFKNAVREIREILIEKKILRMALIILAKRQGAAWCQKNIIKNILLPIVEEEKVTDVAKQFAVSMFGPLLKPYPMDMKVHCEIIVNQLLDMLDQNPSDSMKEAIFTSLIYMNKHNQYRVTQALLLWEPKHVSREFEELLKDFVREKPVKTWTKILPKMLSQQG